MLPHAAAPAPIPVEEALARCLARLLPVRPEAVPLAAALGRSLAAPLVAAHDAPREAQSAMDGYAVLCADLEGAGPADPVALVVDAVVPAGRPPTRPLRRGGCQRVLTGATLPAGAEAVVMQEDVAQDRAAGAARFVGPATPGQHLRRAGSDHRRGDLLLPAGAILGPDALALLASEGHTTAAVWRRPRVAVLATGDELRPPGAPLGPAQRWSSNSTALCALIEEAGGEALDLGLVPDDRPSASAVIAAALAAGPDLLLTSGGVSVGDYDVVKDVFADLGARIDMWQVRIKPGKPLMMAEHGPTRIFGLPGNPLSSTSTFRLFVRTLLRASLGDPRPLLPIVDARAAGPLPHRPGRAELVPVDLGLEGGQLVARAQRISGSGAVAALAGGGGLALLGADQDGALEGDLVPVMLLGAPGGVGSAPGALRWGGRPRAAR
jgi:molybdopterin molybdotransferase